MSLTAPRDQVENRSSTRELCHNKPQEYTSSIMPLLLQKLCHSDFNDAIQFTFY